MVCSRIIAAHSNVERRSSKHGPRFAATQQQVSSSRHHASRCARRCRREKLPASLVYPEIPGASPEYRNQSNRNGPRSRPTTQVAQTRCSSRSHAAEEKEKKRLITLAHIPRPGPMAAQNFIRTTSTRSESETAKRIRQRPPPSLASQHTRSSRPGPSVRPITPSCSQPGLQTSLSFHFLSPLGQDPSRAACSLLAHLFSDTRAPLYRPASTQVALLFRGRERRGPD